MNEDYKNIDNDLLQQYLDGNLQGKALEEFNSKINEDELFKDAVEGLSNINHKISIDVFVNDLNKQLKQYTSSKKNRRLKNKIEIKDWLIFAICFVLITCIVVAFFVLKHK